MPSSCSTVPTLTQTVATTTQSTSTVVSSSVTTSPPTTTFFTSTSVVCNPRDAGPPLCQTITQVTNSTIPGGTQTVGVTQVTVFPVTGTVVNTLFGTSCTSVSAGGGNSVVTSTTSSSSSAFPSLSTVTTMSSSTAANGSVIATLVTETQTISPTSSSTAGAFNSNTNATTTTPHLGAIIGGSVGGFFGLAALALLAWYFWKRSSKWDDIFEREEDAILREAFPKPKRDPNVDPKPKPYEYGLVGHSSVPPHMSPPSSGGLSLSSDSPTAYTPTHNATLHHHYQHSVGQQSGAQQQIGQQQIGHQQIGHQPSHSVTQQQSVGQQASQQQSAMQQQQSVVQQQGQQGQSVMQQQAQQQPVGQQPQQSVGPYNGHGASQQTHVRLPSNTAATVVASLSTRPAAALPLITTLQEASSSASAPPGVWVGAGSSRYPPGMQYNTSAASSSTGRPGTEQRESVVDEDEVYGGIATNVPVTGHSSSNGASGYNHGYSAGLSHAAPGVNAAEFNPYQERQRPVRDQRVGRGRVGSVEKPPIIHLDGGRYRQHVRSPPASVGSESVLSPPAYSS